MENRKLQEYADAQCGGDRYRAIYELLYSGEKGSFDPYVEELSKEEAAFTLFLIRGSAVKAYGSEETFRKAEKANNLAASMDLELDDVKPETKNPYKKKLLVSLLGMVGAIAVTVGVALLNKRVNLGFLAYTGEVLMGLSALSIAEKLILCNRFRRLKRLAAVIPSLPEAKENNKGPVPFEEAMAAFTAKMSKIPSVKPEAAEALVAAAKKRNVKALLWVPVYVVAMFVSMMVAAGVGLAGGIIGAVGLLGFSVWQVASMLRVLRKSKDISYTEGMDPAKLQKLQNRQSLCVLAGLCIAGLYLILTILGCAFSIAGPIAGT